MIDSSDFHGAVADLGEKCSDIQMQEEVTETREFYQAVDHLYDSVAKLSELLEKPIWDLMDFIKIRNLMAQVKLDIEAMRSLAGTSQGFISCLNIYNQIAEAYEKWKKDVEKWQKDGE